MKLVDLHLHSLLSDGELLPSELARRMEELGFGTIALTDHVDWSNLEIIPKIAEVSERLSKCMGISVIAGAELTHIPPREIGGLAKKARELGAKIVVAHGESPVEPVRKGTNLAAIECGEVDILAHPGLIAREEAKKAREAGVYLELTSRKGHCLFNGWVAAVAREVGAKLILNSDAHSPDDLLSPAQALSVARGAGLEEGEVREVLFKNPREILKQV